MILANLSTEFIKFPLKSPFGISRGIKHHAETIRVTLVDIDGLKGIGECVPYSRYGESVQSILAQISNLGCTVEVDREKLAKTLPAGAARNAIANGVECIFGRLFFNFVGITT